MATIRIHNRKRYLRFLVKDSDGQEETVSLEGGKFIDIDSGRLTEDVFNKAAIGLLKLRIRKKNLGVDFGAE